MEKWQTELRLKFRGVPWKIRVGFSYEWKAWLIAYDIAAATPEEFAKLPLETQKNLLAYGAAAWHLMKRRKKVFFAPDDIATALMRASQADGLTLNRALSYARFPDWLQVAPEGKKKDQT